MAPRSRVGATGSTPAGGGRGSHVGTQQVAGRRFTIKTQRGLAGYDQPDKDGEAGIVSYADETGRSQGQSQQA